MNFYVGDVLVIISRIDHQRLIAASASIISAQNGVGKVGKVLKHCYYLQLPSSLSLSLKIILFVFYLYTRPLVLSLLSAG